MTQDQIDTIIARYQNASPEERIAMKQRRLQGLLGGLRYADHGAYGQDLREIESLRREITLDQLRLEQ